MATSIAEHYTDELVDWARLIAFYDQEATEFETKLEEVIQRNSIPNIAAKVEEQQDKLNIVWKKFKGLRRQIQKQVAALKTDSTFIDNTRINTETANKQNELRLYMQQAEREYIDAKYSCSGFLSATLKKY
ncbi:hypothetical protein QWZ08_13185 [Ferruginibacter paludis]|uniref:hypothetical protein n=1 Tax=Ferruginibacter TaxID=1004303 RepID=UPI0025B2EFEE|nr:MULTISPECIES: hypothetical protein [Ferruginibacter]MDB5275671.1 hypothetical protein [Ferruginibacter sp.]MDN3656593.1 hypothetical protein [Ferruginibacter paludis]